MEEKEETKMVDDFDGTPAIDLSDSDAVLEKKIMDIYSLSLDEKLAIIRRIEDARHNSSYVNVGSKTYDYGYPNIVYNTKAPPIDWSKIGVTTNGKYSIGDNIVLTSNNVKIN